MFYEDVLSSFNEGNNTYMTIKLASDSGVDKTLLIIQLAWTMIYCNRDSVCDMAFPESVFENN